MLIHDILKIKYVDLGYIKKNYPYHLISDEEMFNAFIDLGNTKFNETTSIIDPTVRFFDNYYPNPFVFGDYYVKTKTNPDGSETEIRVSLPEEYDNLKQAIIDSINDYLKYYGTAEEDDHKVPNWVYTYMLGEVVYQESDYLDIEDTLALLGCSNIDNLFTKEACVACYATSVNYVASLTTGIRPPTVFGEPHVIKKLRMDA